MTQPKLCELCLQPLGPVRWWDRLVAAVPPFGGPPPIHSSRGEEGTRCRERFAARFGIDVPRDL